VKESRGGGLFRGSHDRRLGCSSHGSFQGDGSKQLVMVFLSVLALAWTNGGSRHKLRGTLRVFWFILRKKNKRNFEDWR